MKEILSQYPEYHVPKVYYTVLSQYPEYHVLKWFYPSILNTMCPWYIFYYLSIPSTRSPSDSVPVSGVPLSKVGSFTSDSRSWRSQKTGEIKVFLNFFACWWKIRIRTNNYESDRPNNLGTGIWLWNTGPRYYFIPVFYVAKIPYYISTSATQSFLSGVVYFVLIGTIIWMLRIRIRPNMQDRCTLLWSELRVMN